MSRRRLLLADDSVTIQKVVNLTFADEGIEVFAVSDGNEAVERLMEISPDLVMADVNMPGINGYQVCERIRQTEKFKNTPVILLVGSFEPFDEEEARRVGANDYLTKPFQSIRQLVNKVTDLLGAAESFERSSAATAGSFADTAEMPKPPVEEYHPTGEAPQYGDAGMDDEMIETSRSDSAAGGFAFDEAQKFVSQRYQTPPAESDFAKTQPLSTTDLHEMNIAGESFQTSAGEIRAEEEFRPTFEEGYAEETPQAQAAETYAPPVSEPETGKAATVEYYDEDEDLLEIPFEDEFEEEFEEEAPPEVVEQPAAVQETAAVEETTAEIRPPGETAAPVETETQAAGAPSQFSPELIDAIARRVIEKLSDRTIKEIAWEVVPQHADLIIKKMVEEKLKE